MANNNEWLQRVVSKLNQVHMNGSNFLEERWIFDWDDKLSNTDNFKNIRREERALSTLNEAKVVRAIFKDNFYRDQQEESLALHGRGMWSDYEGADPALRLYDYIWYLWEFDCDRFLRFCETHELSLVSTGSVASDDTVAEEGEHLATIRLTQQTLKLELDGVTHTIKRFDSKKRFNYNLAKLLLSRPDEWIKKVHLGTKFKTIRSRAKDWPKLMGFTGELRDTFLSVNKTEQTIMLNLRRSLTTDEAEILKRFVNTPKLR